VVGITILVGTIPLEYIVRKRLPRPMFPASVYGKYRQYTVFLPPILLCGLVFSATSTLWPQQVQLLYTQDPIKAGWYISAPPLTGILFAPLYGWILQRFSRHTRWILTFLVGVLTLFSGLQAVISKYFLRAEYSSCQVTNPTPQLPGHMACQHSWSVLWV